MNALLSIFGLLIVVGGIIAFVGDWLGRRIGRKKLSLFGLRPRYTAILFTVISGAIIALVTTSILLAVSQDARNALFSLEELKNALSQNTRQLSMTKKELDKKTSQLSGIKGEMAKIENFLKQARSEISSLTALKNQLKQEVSTARSGNLLFKINSTITLEVISSLPENPGSKIKEIIASAQNQGAKIQVKGEDLSLAAEDLKQQNYPVVLRLLAKRNTVTGELIEAKIDIQPNRLLFKQGQEITSGIISGKNARPQIQKELEALVQKALLLARQKGMLYQDEEDNLAAEYTDIIESSRQIKLYQGPVKVFLLSKNNTFVAGPMLIAFRFIYQ